MSLWDTLSIFAGAVAFGAALAAPRIAGAGNVMLAVAVGLGLALGGACILVVRTVGKHVFGGISGAEASPRTERMLRLVYLGAAAWIVVSGILGFQITAVVLRLMGN